MKISFQHKAAVAASKCINTAFRVDNLHYVTLPSPALRQSSLSRGWCGPACRACCPSGARSCTSCWCPACVGAPPAAMTLKYILLHHNRQWNTEYWPEFMAPILAGFDNLLGLHPPYSFHCLTVWKNKLRRNITVLHQLKINISITKYRHWNFSIV